MPHGKISGLMNREQLKFFIRLVIAGLLFWYLYETLDWKAFFVLVEKANFKWLLIALASYGVTTLCSIFRWHLLLSAFHAQMKLKRTAQLTMIGLFGNCFLPGAMSGDVLKLYYATKELPHAKPTVIMSVVMDRLLGFVAMFLVSTLLIISRWEGLTSNVYSRYAVYVYFVVFGLSLLAIGLGSWSRAAKWLPFKDRLPWQKSLKEAGEAYRFFLKHPVCFWGGLLISAVAHFGLMGTFYFVSIALRMDLNFWDLAAGLPLVALATIIPATPNGLGVREVAFKHFLAFTGMTEEGRVAISLVGFFVILAWNLFGGIFYLWFRSHDSTPSSDNP